MPASLNAGSRSGTLRFRWTDGHTQEQPVVWQVVPVIAASPSKLVLRRSERDLTHIITVRAFDNRPFSISDAGPSDLVASCEFDRGARSVHTLRLRIDTDRASRERDSKVTIKTDFEDQPTVSLSVVVLPPGA